MTQIAISGRNASIDAVNNFINNGTVEIRTGQPAQVDAEPTGIVIAIITLGSTAFNLAVDGVSIANSTLATTALTTGTAGHYVVKDTTGKVQRNGTAGVTGSNMILNRTSIVENGEVKIASWQFNQLGQ
tara:strand:- start:1858 stop:2244 length:387 start_codon:yes stop_codon:yes gene_type:complete